MFDKNTTIQATEDESVCIGPVNGLLVSNLTFITHVMSSNQVKDLITHDICV
jgi:hypothetical protein